MLKSKKRKIGILLAVITFYVAFIFYNDVNQFSYQWTKIEIWFIPIILGLHFVVLLLRTSRQKILLDSLDIKITWKENFRIHMAGLSLIMTPGGVGQTIKSYYLKNKYKSPYSKTVSVSLAERYHDLLGIIPIIGILLFFRESFFGWIIIGVLAAILLAIFVLVRNQKITKLVLSKIPKISLLKRISENSDTIGVSLHSLTKRGVFLSSLGIDLLSWCVAALAFYLSFLAFGLDVSFIDATYISFVPITLGAISFLPGGFGVTEVSMLSLLTKYGLAPSIAAALILFTRITSIWFFTIIGLIATRFVIDSKNENINQ